MSEAPSKKLIVDLQTLALLISIALGIGALGNSAFIIPYQLKDHDRRIQRLEEDNRQLTETLIRVDENVKRLLRNNP